MDVWDIRAEDAYACLEPEIVTPGLDPEHHVTINTVHLGLSIARSLKRIADLLEVVDAEDGKVITLPQIMLYMLKEMKS